MQPMQQLPPSTPTPRLGRLFFAAAAILLLAAISFALVRAGVFYSFYTSLLDNVIETTGFDLSASRAIALALAAILWFLPWHLLLLPWIGNAKKQVVTLLMLSALAITAMEIVTRDVYFSRADGRPLKYYIQTLDGYKFAALPGVDPVYGLPYQPITADVARHYIVWKRRGGKMQDRNLPQDQNFNAATGDPLRWYARRPDGRIDMFTLPGFHPTYGTKLLPATTTVVTEYEHQQAVAERRKQAAEARKRWREEQAIERQARAEVIRKAEEERDRQAREQERLQQPLQPGRYLFAGLLPKGRVGELSFTLAEIDLAADRLLVHVEIDDVGETLSDCCIYARAARFSLLAADGARIGVLSLRHKAGTPIAANGTFEFSHLHPHGAFVMEFPKAADLGQTFSLAVNDEPTFGGINLRNVPYQPF
jgi:hypothetical protein